MKTSATRCATCAPRCSRPTLRSSVVKDFIERIRVRAIGQEVAQSLTPGQALVKLVHDELVELMGAANDQLDLTAAPPAIVLMAGLQGVR